MDKVYQAGDFIIELHPGAPDGTDRPLLKVRCLSLERDGEAAPGHVIAYLDEVGGLVEALVNAAVDLVSITLGSVAYE